MARRPSCGRTARRTFGRALDLDRDRDPDPDPDPDLDLDLDPPSCSRRRRSRRRDGPALVPLERMRLGLSGDHRVIDGATGARFLQTPKAILESPVRPLVG